MTSPYVPRVSAVDVGETRLLARMELGEYCQRTRIATRIPLLLSDRPLGSYPTLLYGNTARLYGKSEHMNSLARLICSRVRAEIFRVLFGVKAGELHLREIQRQTGFAIGTVRQDIGKLVKLGLVTSRRDGNRVYYAANGQHPFYTEMRLLVLKTVGMADVLAEALKAADIQCAFVFGSVAGGTEGAGSDVDLMVIGEIGLRRVSSMLAGVGNRLGREINPHVMNSAEFTRRASQKDHFVTSLLATPRIFVKGSEDVLKGLGG